MMLYTKFHQDWFSRSACNRPQLLNVQCTVARQRPLLWQPHHGGHVGTQWDATTQVSSRSVHWQASYSITNIFQYGGRPLSGIGTVSFWTKYEVNYAVQLPSQNLESIWSSLSEILQFYDFASLAGKCLTTTLFGGLNPLKLWVVIQTPKTHIFG